MLLSKALKTVIQKFRFLDMYGIPIELNLKECRDFKSNPGAFITIIVLFFSMFSFFLKIDSWLNAVTTIYSTENYSVRSILDKNLSIQYVLQNSNYNLFFSVNAFLPDKTLGYQDLFKYFTIEYKYSKTGKDFDFVSIESEPCNSRNQNEFLGLNYDKEKIPADKTDEFQMCVKNPFLIGLQARQSEQLVWFPILSFEIKECVNSTENNFFCASVKEIQDIVKYVRIQASIPKTIYDFQNKTQPIQKVFSYQFFYLDFNMKMRLVSDINPSYLYKDLGIISEDYYFQNLNFNAEKPVLNVGTKNQETKLMFQYQMKLSFQIDNIYLKNEKLNDLLGSFGGMLNILFSVGRWISLFINQHLLANILINSAFNFVRNPTILNHVSKKNKKNETTVKKKNKFIYSFPKYLRGMLQTGKKSDDYILFARSKKYLNEYIDLKKLIRRLQDIDKLKSVLFNESERFFFDLIPKPEIIDEKRRCSLFSIIDIIKKKKKLIMEHDLKNFYKNLNPKENSIDERILSFLDEKVKQKLNIKSRLKTKDKWMKAKALVFQFLKEKRGKEKFCAFALKYEDQNKKRDYDKLNKMEEHTNNDSIFHKQSERSIFINRDESNDKLDICSNKNEKTLFKENNSLSKFIKEESHDLDNLNLMLEIEKINKCLTFKYDFKDEED